MNKESIYRIIGYNGDYNDNVKKAIRKLLKENHPDNKGDRRIFELINEVKKELEENRVSYDYKNKNSNVNITDDIDYLFCAKMIDKISKEKHIYANELSQKKQELLKVIEEYKKAYQSSIDLETYLLTNSTHLDKLKKTKIISVSLIIIAIILFIISVWKKNIILFVFFVIIVILCVIIINKAFDVIQKLTDNNRQKINSYVSSNSHLRISQRNQEKLKKEINDINKKIVNLDNDLRFYNNIINNRG